MLMRFVKFNEVNEIVCLLDVKEVHLGCTLIRLMRLYGNKAVG